MNRLKYITFTIFTLLVLGSCVKEVVLKPFELPDLVQSFVRKVECFDQEKAAFIATDEGVLLLYGDEKQQVIFDASRFPELSFIDWPNSEVLYTGATETFWVIQDSIFLTFDRNKRLKIHTDRSQFNISTSNYFSYTLSNNGELYRIGFYKEFWAGPSSGFSTDLFIGIYKFIGNENNTWEEFQTDMIIKSENVAAPNSVFTPQGDLIIATNPQFLVTNISKANTQFTLLGKVGNTFKFKTIYQPYLSSDGTVFGFDKIPDFNSPLQNILTTKINENEVQSFQIEASCAMPEFSRGIIKLVDWNENVVRLYAYSASGQPNQSIYALGYIISYNAVSGDCDVMVIESGNELTNSSLVQDMDIYGNTVFIGTNNGLFVYDIETRAVSSYLNQLLAYYQE